MIEPVTPTVHVRPTHQITNLLTSTQVNMPKREPASEENDELDAESVVTDEKIDPNIFSIRDALEQPDAKVYTTLELHSEPFCCGRRECSHDTRSHAM